MFDMSVIKARWIFLILFGGIAFVIYFCLYYFMMWKPRGKNTERHDDYKTRYLPAYKGITLPIIILLILAAIYTVMYSVYRINNPTSW